MKKNVYMYQPNYFYGKDAYLPYSVGVLAAYAWSDDYIKNQYELKGIGYARDNIDFVVENLEEPYLCAFSCYTWNYEYNKELASAIKKIYPACKIIFGGHQIAREYSDNSTDYVDVFIYDEGEVPFKELLLAYAKDDNLSEVPNIKYKISENVWKTTEIKMIAETEFPSPYLMGIFDQIMENQSLVFSATLETNRGCPFSCAYCDWGVYKSKLRKFSMEKVKAEIDWFAEHGIEYIFCADGNFGIFERDEEIIDYVINKKKTIGYPKKFRVCYTKNTGDRVFRISQKLNSEGMSKGATLSFQSLNDKTLEAVGRKNIPLNHFSNLMELYHSEDIPTYSELILGLPEETYSSFCNGIDQLLENGQHTSIFIYLCQLFPNSAMGKTDFIYKHKIKITDTILSQDHYSFYQDDVVEYSKIVTETSTLSFNEWKKMYLYSLVIQSFHCFGLTQCIAIYLHYEYGKMYNEFYMDVLEWCMEYNNTIAGKIFKHIDIIFNKFIDGKAPLTYINPIFGDIGWPLEEALYLEILYDIKQFYLEFKEFLKLKYPYIIFDKLGNQLLEYQELVNFSPYSKDKEVIFDYDFYTYFSEILLGKNYNKLSCEGKYRYKIEIDSIKDWDRFAKEIIWQGKKGGKNI